MSGSSKPCSYKLIVPTEGRQLEGRNLVTQDTLCIDTAAKATKFIGISSVRLLSSRQNVQQPHADEGTGIKCNTCIHTYVVHIEQNLKCN